jgi:Transposase, Mutator family
MALDQSALLEVLDALRNADAADRIKQAKRLNKEIKRRTDVVGVFPYPAALLRLAGSRHSGNRQSLRQTPARFAPFRGAATRRCRNARAADRLCL